MMIFEYQVSKQQRAKSATAGQGFSILESLVALVVLSIGVLGVASVQLSTLKLNQVSQQRSVATLAINNITDRMRSNLIGVRAGNYAFNFDYLSVAANKPAAVNCTTSCTTAQIAQQHLNQWLTELDASLPEGRGVITGGANTTFQIAVMWREKDLGINQSLRSTRACPNVATLPLDVQCVVANFQP
ncbi:MAG: type IV pilus modification protein PilV [Burkholderiaceae bacterium]